MLHERECLDSIIAVILDGRIDWARLVDPGYLQDVLYLANYHGVEALVIDRLAADAGWQTLPFNVQDELKSRLKKAAIIQMARSQDLISAAKALENAGTRMLLLKGGGLASSHYPLPYLRDRCDTDVFIDLKRIELVREVFSGLGFQSQGAVYRSHQFDYISVRAGGLTIHYDVHWRISNRSAFSRLLSFEEACNEAVPLDDLRGVWGLKPVHALLLACIHRAANPGHDPNRLIWIYDIHLLSQAFSEDEWIEFCELAVSRGLQQVCLQALQKSTDTFKMAIPPQVASSLAVPLPHQTLGDRFRMSQLGLIWDDLREFPNFSSRMEMLKEYVFPSEAFLRERYDKSSRAWLPLLYCRYLMGGLVERFSLR